MKSNNSNAVLSPMHRSLSESKEEFQDMISVGNYMQFDNNSVGKYYS